MTSSEHAGCAPADLRIHEENSSVQAQRRDGLLAAHLGAQHVGALDFSVVGQELHIHVLYVRPAFRRRGIARALLDFLRASHPGLVIQGGSSLCALPHR